MSPAQAPREFRVGGRVLRTGECFDVYWRFAAERQRIRNVICRGSQDVDEVMFRVLLFKLFNRVETWQLLTAHLCGVPSWHGYGYGEYDGVLSAAMHRGERIYSAAYIVPNPSFGQPRKHGNHLRLIEHAMAGGLPDKVAAASNLRDLYEPLLALPSLGPFLAYQLAVDIAYSDVTAADEAKFVVAGPGAIDGLTKCFADTAGLPAAAIVEWLRDTSREHFSRLGLDFQDLWGRWPSLVDWQNVFCEVSKYTRVTHPHVAGASGRTRIKQEFRQTPAPIDYRFPAKWGLPSERTARLISAAEACRSATGATDRRSTPPPPAAHTARMHPSPVVIA